MAKAWCRHLDEARCRQRAHLKIGFDSGGTRALQDRHPPAGVAVPWLVHLFMQARKTEMEDARPAAVKIEMVGCQQAAGAGVVEMRAPARFFGSKGVSKGRPASRKRHKARAVEPFPLCLCFQDMAVSIITQQADGGHGQIRIKAFDANRKVAGRTAAANLLIEYQHLVFFTRPAIHQLVVVGTPCAAGDDAVPVLRRDHSASGLRIGSVTSRSS